MSDTEEEWTTVRRRRGGRSGVSKQLKALAIPVVPLAFDALAEPEERSAQDTVQPKKKKKGKKTKGAEAKEDDAAAADKAGFGASGATGLARGTFVGAAAAKAAGSKPATAGDKAAQVSFFAWLLSRLVALLAMLGLMRAAGAGRKKRKSKAASGQKAATQEPSADPKAAATAPPPPATTKPAAPAPAKATAAEVAAKAKPQAAAAPAAAAPFQSAPKQQQQAQPPKPAAKETAPATTAKKQAEPSAPTLKADTTAAAPATPPPAAVAVAATPAAAAAGSDTKPKAAEPPLPPPAPATPAAPPPPVIKYDADWNRGKFVMQSLPAAHADVVAAVALAGDVAVSAGYDGAVKLWHWPTTGTSGGGVVPRLALSRTLVGHSGRVEALSAHAESRRLATSGRDSTLKVWGLGSEPGGSGAGELASTYVYESVRSLAADWTGEGGGAAGRVLLGARSGTVLLYSLGGGGSGRKLAALRGHRDEVTALRFLYGSGGSGQVAVSGSRDGIVRLWDLRAAGGGAATAVLNGLSGRVCAVSPLGPHHLVAGDCSSTVKMWDLRQLPASASAAAASPPPAPRRLPNAPGFAGDICPTAGLWHGPRSGVLLSSCIAWWTTNKQALEEASPAAKLPMACLNVSAVGIPTTAASAAATAADGTGDASSQPGCQYQYTLRLGPGVVTCLAGSDDEGEVLAGGASGAMWALRLVRGGSAAVAAAERAAAAAAAVAAAAGDAAAGGASGGSPWEVVDALVVGAEEFSDDEYDDGDEEDEDG